MPKTMHWKSLVSIPMFLAVALAACTVPGRVTDPTPTTEPDQPVNSDTAVPSPMEPTEPVGNVIQGMAVVESVEILILESFPVQVHVVAKGKQPDACTTIDDVIQTRNANVFEATITTVRPANALCPQTLVPFEKVIPLDVAGLPAGTYTVDVNGVMESFTLDVDNTLPTDEYGDPEYL